MSSRLFNSNSKSSVWDNNFKRVLHDTVYVFLPFLCFLGLISLALFLQSDASTLGIITLTLLVIYFSAKTPFWHTLVILLAGICVILLMVKFEPYRLSRWLTFLHPEADPLGTGFQLRQSLISLGSGGIFGKGLGMSVQKFGFLPQSMTDSMFAVIGEELGILGSVAIVVVFIWFFYLGLKISKNSTDKFSQMIAIGIVFWITFQAFINISATSGIFPLTGIPLPFLSYGGSHLLSELVGVGLLLNISKNT